MTDKEFINIQEKLKKFKYTSMQYIEYEQIQNYDEIHNDEKAIALYGYNNESKTYEYHWASNRIDDLLSIINNSNTNTLITFVPRSWTKELERYGFEIFAIWNDYFIPNIDSVKSDTNPKIINADECENVSKVTLSCRGQSRGFTGQSKEWVKQWILGEAPAVPEYTKNCAVLVHRIDGEIVGVICVGTYAHDSDKGAILWIREVAVLPEFQRRSIARELINQALVYGKKHGTKRAFLMADECNVHAIHLYKSLGFVANKDEAQIDMIK